MKPNSKHNPNKFVWPYPDTFVQAWRHEAEQAEQAKQAAKAATDIAISRNNDNLLDAYDAEKKQCID